MPNKKILIIYTGGTFATTSDLNILGIDSDNALIFAAYIKNKYKDCDFVFKKLEQLYCSENLDLDNLNCVLDLYKDCDFQSVDGVIITHGTDTLAYFAAFTSIVLSKIKKPIVIVSSNKPLDYAYKENSTTSNGLINFDIAIKYITNNIYKSNVVVAYDNMDGNANKIYFARKISQSQPFIDTFSHFDNNFNHDCSFIDYDINNIQKIEKKVLLIEPYPGLDYDLFNINSDVAAVLQKTYHSFTMCTTNNEYSFIKFYEKLNKKNIPLYIASSNSDLNTAYQSNKTVYDIAKVKNNNLYVISDTSVEFGYMQVLIAHNTNSDIKLSHKRVGIKIMSF